MFDKGEKYSNSFSIVTVFNHVLAPQCDELISQKISIEPIRIAHRTDRLVRESHTQMMTYAFIQSALLKNIHNMKNSSKKSDAVIFYLFFW